ncbi:ATP-dependent DNA helicase srs2 [Diplogelasinospora grovesii]|uniref:DNA 3'-5' helicase n=1 Tax=Diplogelasinospora grovesii TaxID=303347 RepID=A0AAN6NHD3_9PEZI|nr:ATP-dependent DNA helicase srs2 [Diplogelasinospora grovesii]
MTPLLDQWALLADDCDLIGGHIVQLAVCCRDCQTEALTNVRIQQLTPRTEHTWGCDKGRRIQLNCRLDAGLGSWLTWMMDLRVAKQNSASRTPLVIVMREKSSILETLNKAQCRAVSSNASTVAILAGPGSGKTHTLTSRVVWLVDHVGHRPEDVLVATFTVKAAREMKERIGKALGDGREKKIVLGTFHSIARRYLAAYGKNIGLNQKFGIADDGDSRSIVTRICKRLQLNVDPPAARAWISKKKAKGTEASATTSRRQAAEKAMPGLQDLETCYAEYQAHLERSNLLDYDDLLVRGVELLRKFPSCVSNIQSVLIDEYQDTNGVQYELMKLFAQYHKRITIVGDPDQSIYGWRSAEIRNLWRMLRDFPGTDEISLEENYRSSQSILNLSLQVIQQDKNRYQKVLKPVHNRGTRPVLRRLKSASVEGEWIVSEIRRVLLMSGSMLNHNDVAILLRSAALSRHIESALGKAGIAYKMVGGFKFYERAEIKILIDYLRVIHQPENNDAFARIMNVPKRGIGDGTIKSLVEEAETSSLSVWNLLAKHCRGDRVAKTKLTKRAEQTISGELLRMLNGIRKKIEEIATGTPFGLVEMMEQLLTSLHFQKFLQDTHPDDHEQRWANVQEFISLAADFVRDLDRAGDDALLPEIDGVQQSKEVDVLPQFLANISLASDIQKGEDGQEDKPQVTISTIHAAKGLEWPVVFIPAVYNGSIPHIRSEDSDEERRLLYVAMTRAQSLLYLSCPNYSSTGNGERNELSEFMAPVSAAFAKKGPCFDRPVVKEMAQILGRELPSEEAIFKGLPPMSYTEDSLFPVDPDEEQRRNANGDDQTNNAPRPKRQRISGPGGAARDGEEQEWRKEYATTMEQSGTFTVSSLPGFVSAGSHQVALAAAAAAEQSRVEASKAVERAGKRPTSNKRPADQRSILGFVRTASNSSTGSAPGSTSKQALPAKTVGTGPGRPEIEIGIGSGIGRQMARSATFPGGGSGFRSGVGAGVQHIKNNTNNKPAVIEPELAAHRIGSGRVLMARPTHHQNDRVKKEENEEDVPRKQYACFSSSPTKPDRLELDTEVKKGSGGGGGSDENEPPPEPTRAAACLHATTVNLPKGLGGGFRRPVGLGREGIAPMDKLRKPFKPLTISRPS